MNTKCTIEKPNKRKTRGKVEPISYSFLLSYEMPIKECVLPLELPCPSFCMRPIFVNSFTTLVIFIIKRFGWLGFSLDSLDC